MESESFRVIPRTGSLLGLLLGVGEDEGGEAGRHDVVVLYPKRR